MKHLIPWITTVAIMAPLAWTDDTSDMARLNMTLPMTWESEWRSPRMAEYATCDRGARCRDPYAEIVDRSRTADNTTRVQGHVRSH